MRIDLISFSCCEEVPGVESQFNCRFSAGGLGKLLFLRDLYSALRRTDGVYDSVVLHFVYPFMAFFLPFLRGKSRRLISVVWGSDFYRSSFVKRVAQAMIFWASTRIVFTNPETLKDFSRGVLRPKSRLCVARFGLPVLDQIERYQENDADRSALCGFFGLPAERKIVLVGYNSSPAQRHVDIVRELRRLDSSIRNRMHLVFHLGRGGDQLKSTLRDLLAECEIAEYTILSEFYGFSDIARLRCVTDILINVQVSDQFSGSMQETLYAGGVVVAGDWLPYQELLSFGRQICLVHSLGELPAMVEQIVVSKASSHTSPGLKDYIAGVSSWSATMHHWDDALFGGAD
ncbi:hypothetical protein [Pseudomonas sp. TCU-HL1]|uniref:hypothetical protein n=1 Tax=Pseudomonas sp. TCU-HL1 TaxID=1856685 RepID=UPI00083CD7E7|nr:hypothetical protein [Pseudomonas sp. TCU-HL1]